jgi:hypothetical protein
VLLYIGPDLDAVGADRPAVPEQFRGGGLDDALIGHMGEREALDPDEIEAGRQRHGQRLVIGPRQDLHAAGQRRLGPDRGRDDRHGRDDFGTHPAPEVRRVVHVFDQQPVDARVPIDFRLTQRSAVDFPQGSRGGRSSGQGAEVDHRDDRLRNPKEARRRRHGGLWP